MLEQLRQVSIILATFRQNVQELLHENEELRKRYSQLQKEYELCKSEYDLMKNEYDECKRNLKKTTQETSNSKS